MTVASDTNRVRHAGNGTTTAFSTSFIFLLDADVKVVEQSAAGVDTVKTLTTHYTLAGAGTGAAGTVTMLIAPGAGTSLLIYRDPAMTQATAYSEGGDFPAASHEAALDKLTRIHHRTRELVERSPSLIEADVDGTDGRYDFNDNRGVDLADPEDDQDAATMAYVNAQILAGALADYTGVVTTFGASLLADADLGEAHETLGLGDWAPEKNLLLNGSFQVNQVAASYATHLDGAYGPDGWLSRMPNTDQCVITWTRDTGIPDETTLYALKVAIGTAETVVNDDEYLTVSQYVEAPSATHLAFGTSDAKTLVLSFWVKCSAAETFSVSLSNNAEDKSYVREFTVAAINTWQKVEVTFPGETAGTWLRTDAGTIGLRLNFCLGAGASFKGAANAWNAANDIGGNNQHDLMAVLNATFFLAQVQLEVGSIATPFERKSYAAEQLEAERFYEKSYDDGTYAPTNTAVGMAHLGLAADGGADLQVDTLHVPFRTTKCKAPTVTSYDRANPGTADDCTSTSGDGQTAVISQQSDRGFLLTNDDAAADDVLLSFHWVAVARLA